MSSNQELTNDTDIQRIIEIREYALNTALALYDPEWTLEAYLQSAQEIVDFIYHGV